MTKTYKKSSATRINMRNKRSKTIAEKLKIVDRVERKNQKHMAPLKIIGKVSLNNHLWG